MRTHNMIIRKIFLSAILMALIGCLSFTALARAAQSQDTALAQQLAVGESKIIELKARAAKIEITDPTIAEVMVLTPWRLYLTGKNPGSTRLIMRNGNNTIASIMVIEVAPNVAQLKIKLHEMFPQEKDIRVHAGPDNITLSGTVSNAANLSQVIALAQSYAPVSKDKDTNGKVTSFLEVGGVQQVMLEVRVSEISRSLLRRLGVNFNYITDKGANLGITLLGNLTGLPAQGWPGNALEVSDVVNYIAQFPGHDATWTAFVDALKEEGLVKVLAEPTLITLSGKTANFLAGGEYPIPVPQDENITIDYKPYGVGLNFTPTVLGNGKISMQVNPEVSELNFNNSVQISGYIVPALTTRRVATTIELADGQSFAIAGLLSSNLREVVKKFPGLGEIPVLGALFRSTSYQKDETELVIIVTPHLVKPLDMAKQTLPTDAFIEPNEIEFYLLGSMEGHGENTQAKPKAAIVPDSGGLDGDFGYIKPE